MKKSVTQIKKSELSVTFYSNSCSLTPAYRHAVSDGALFWSWFWRLNPAKAAAAAAEAASAMWA